MSTIIIMMFAGVVSVITIVYTIGVIIDDCREKRRRDLGYPEDEEPTYHTPPKVASFAASQEPVDAVMMDPPMEEQ